MKTTQLIGTIGDYPSYLELMSMYFESQRKLICEFSGDIGADTLRLFHKCNIALSSYYKQPTAVQLSSLAEELINAAVEDEIDNEIKKERMS